MFYFLLLFSRKKQDEKKADIALLYIFFEVLTRLLHSEIIKSIMLPSRFSGRSEIKKS